MALSLRAEHLKRYRDVAWLLVKYGRSDVVHRAGLDEALGDDRPEPREAPPEAVELADDLERLGPTFVKLGQLLSTRADLLPTPYLDALARLQDHCEPVPFEEIERVVEAELGARLSKAFSRFEDRPLAAASLGQVHRARLRDGREVAVKVQRPGIRERIVDDLDALGEIAEFLDDHTERAGGVSLSDVVEEFRKAILQELDYRREAANLETIAHNLERYDEILVPLPVTDYSTSRVLTMDFIRGRKVTALSPLARLEMDAAPLADVLFAAYLRQILVDGVFHADPHPGNVFLTDDGRLALLDLGMVGRVSQRMRERLLSLLLAISEGQGEEAADVALRLGSPDPERLDEERFRADMGQLVDEVRGSTVEEIAVGRIVLEISRMAARSGIAVPREMTMLGKTLLNLDAVGRALDPDFDPDAAIRRHAAELTRERMKEQASPGNVLSSLIETAEFAERLPRRVNRILDQMASNELRFRVDAIDERTLIEGFQKVANRIAMGLVLGALIVGAAMLMRVPTKFEILGYPGLAILCFAGAAAGGVWLLVTILLQDRRGGD